jgi:hypothetical protein
LATKKYYLGFLLGDFWIVLGDFWRVLGDFWRVLGDFWSVLGDFFSLNIWSPWQQFITCLRRQTQKRFFFFLSL